MNRALALDCLPSRRACRPVPAKVTMRDDRLPHQIRLTFAPGATCTEIAVSCTCRATGGSGPAGPVYRPLAKRARWDDPDGPMRAWRGHMDEVKGREGAAHHA